MKVLITGATGFIGSHVVLALLARGHEVRVLARSTSDVSGLPASVAVVRGELGAAADACAGMDGLVHLAGISGEVLRRGDPGRQLQQVNVDGTSALFAAARRAGVRRGVHVTSMWTVLRPELADDSAYVRSRLASELAAIEASGATLQTVILCPSFVVGAGDRGPNFPGGIVRAFMRGRLPVAPPGGSTWIAASDTADTVVAALERGPAGGRYALGAEFMSYREVGRAVAAMTGRRAPLATAPRAVVTCGGWVADRGLGLVGRTAPLPFRFGAELLCQRAVVDCTASWRDLGRPRVPVIDAIGEAVAWFQAHPAA